MPTCPAGHDSATDDWCDFCGIAFPARPADVSAPPSGPAPAPPEGMPPPPSGSPVSTVPPPSGPPPSGPPPSGPPPSSPPPSSAPSGGPAETDDTVVSAHCPVCGLGRTGRFCEGCGHDFEAVTTVVRPSQGHTPPAASAAPEWTAVVGAEPAYYQSLADRGILDPDMVKFPGSVPQRRLRLTGGVVRIGRRSSSRGTEPEIDFSGHGQDPAISHEHAELRYHPGGSWVVVDCKSANGTAVNDASRPIEPDTEVPLSDGDRIFLGAWTVITLRKG